MEKNFHHEGHRGTEKDTERKEIFRRDFRVDRMNWIESKKS